MYNTVPVVIRTMRSSWNAVRQPNFPDLWIGTNPIFEKLRNRSLDRPPYEDDHGCEDGMTVQHHYMNNLESTRALRGKEKAIYLEDRNLQPDHQAHSVLPTHDQACPRPKLRVR